MKRCQAFTIIETALVIGLTALIFVAFIASVGSSIAGQRYSDSTQNFAEFLRRQYSSVINVQSAGSGNTNQAIYGRLLTFGEDNDGTIYSYDVIGNAYDYDKLIGNKSILAALRIVNATILVGDYTNAICSPRPINEESYNLTYGAWLETTAPREGAGKGQDFRGSILIVRSPVSGTISTLFAENEVIPVQQSIEDGLCTVSALDLLGTKEDSPNTTILDNFKVSEINFCIGSDDQPSADVRRNVRIASGATNTSAIQIIGQESEDNKCN